MDMTQALLAKIERHCSETGIAETTFGLRAVNDGKIVPRLRAGKNVTINTIRKLEQAMEPSVEPAQ